MHTHKNSWKTLSFQMMQKSFIDEIYEVDEKRQQEINDSPSQENSKSRVSISFSVVTSELAQ